jgi:hypothetical protein
VGEEEGENRVDHFSKPDVRRHHIRAGTQQSSQRFGMVYRGVFDRPVRVDCGDVTHGCKAREYEKVSPVLRGSAHGGTDLSLLSFKPRRVNLCVGRTVAPFGKVKLS